MQHTQYSAIPLSPNRISTELVLLLISNKLCTPFKLDRGARINGNGRLRTGRHWWAMCLLLPTEPQFQCSPRCANNSLYSPYARLFDHCQQGEHSASTPTLSRCVCWPYIQCCCRVVPASSLRVHFKIGVKQSRLFVCLLALCILADLFAQAVGQVVRSEQRPLFAVQMHWKWFTNKIRFFVFIPRFIGYFLVVFL